MSLFNLDLLRSISGGSEEGVKEILISFHEELGSQKSKILNVIASEQYAPLAKIMHNIKSMMGIINDQKLAANVSEMAKASYYDQEKEVVKDKILQFLHEADLLRNDAEQIINQLSSK
jgi:HPt (histidine-containing phosphotransfer) domain-containing protein